MAINPSGLIAGLSSDASNASHGFVCDTNGAIITLDVPGEGTGSDDGPVAWSINPGGVIAGDVIDPGFSANHGIMRTVAMLSVIDCVVDCVPFAI